MIKTSTAATLVAFALSAPAFAQPQTEHRLGDDGAQETMAAWQPARTSHTTAEPTLAIAVRRQAR